MQRLDPPDPSMYTDDQKRVADAISGTRGSIRGPFGPWLHVPGFADPSQQVGAFLRYNSKIPGNLRELAICTVGQYWQADYEWFAHAPLAVEEGVDDGAIELLRNGDVPQPLSDQEQQVYELTREIITTGRLSDASYGSGVANFGNEIMIELIGICGYYTLISFTLNVFKVPVSEGESSPFYR